MFAGRRFKLASIMSALVVVFSMAAVDFAEARPGGSFGSRGTRTFSAPAPTQTAPRPTAPLQRSMTPGQTSTARNTATAGQPRGGLFGGFGGTLFRGLMFGGLLGLLFGSGFGGIGGVLSLLVQVLLIGGGILLLMRFFRSSSRPAMAGGPTYSERRSTGGGAPDFGGLGSVGAGGAATRRRGNPDELGISQRDLDIFEEMLGRVQLAYGREDYGALRQLTTPEMVSYLAEQLGENASQGRRNHLADVKLLQGDVSESWREGGTDYATVAMRYQLRDWTVDRTSEQVVEGDPDRLDQVTELWTFVRPRGEQWKLSAIQQA